MMFKTTITDINKMAVAIDKISTMTLPNYSGLGVAIEGLTAKQMALVLSTRNLSQAELEEVVRVNNLIKKYGAEQLIKAGLLSENSSLLVSEKAVSAEKLKESIIQSAINKEKAEEFIQTQLIVAANGNESASTILLNRALLDEAVKREILTKEKAAEILSTYGVVDADNTEIGSKKGLAKAINGLIKDRIRLSKLDISAIGGVATLITVLYKCSNAVKEVRDKAQELGSLFKDTSSSIKDYKTQIEELYKTINDNKSSIEDVTTARKNLMSIQDALIDKFGTEKSVIQNVTDAINGQTDALDRLTNVEWQERKNEFNKTGFWGGVSNFFQGTNNIQRMLEEYGKQNIVLPWVEYAGDLIGITDEMVAKLENIGIDIHVNSAQGMRDFDSLTESIVGKEGISLYIEGNAEEIYNKILSLQNLANGDDSFGKLYKNIERHANSYKELTDKYKDFYNQYILYEKILTDGSDYADTFKAITDAYEEYNEAFISGDEDKIKEATQKYAEVLTEATSTAIANGDSDVATYFENMYPTLKSTVEGWKFNIAFDANNKNLQNEVQSVLDKLKDENGRSLTAEEILGLGEANEQYRALVSIAHNYNLSIEEMIELLKERNLVSAMDYQGLVDLFGQENVDKLSLEDLEIAYTIKNIGNMTFDELCQQIDRLKLMSKEPPVSLSDIFSLKDADNNLTKLGKISESIDTIQNAYKTLNDAIDEYNEEGAFSIDTLQSVIALGDDWLDYLVDEEGNLKLDKEALEELTQARLNDMRIQAINNVIDDVSKIHDEAGANEYLASTHYALADSYKAVATAKLEATRANMAKAVEAGDLSQSSMDAALNKAMADIDKINKLFANTSIGAGSITGNLAKGKSSSQSEFSETVDFFEHRVEVLDDALSHLKSTMDNISGSSAKNNLVDAELGITGEKFKNYTDALAMYTKKANEAFSKIPADIASKVKDGAVTLTDFIGDGNKDVVEAIKDYESWTDKISDCKQELAELQKEIRQFELEKFNNIMKDFQNQFDLRGDSKDLLSKQIDLLKAAGELIGESFFTAQIDQSKKQLELLEAEKAQLVNQMSSAINSGRIQKGTDEWLEMVNALSDVDSSILDCKKSIEEFDNSILEIHTEIFNRIQDQFSNLDSEISNILDLFEEFEVSDEKGIWSKEGIAQLGLLSQQYELAQYQIQQYNDEIDELNKQYLAGKYSATEYADKLADLTDKQWDAVKASESAKDALMDLNETRIENQISGIEKEIDAYKELTDAQIDALKASKDLHDYEKSIAEKTKSITDLERQIAAMQNDNSAATVAKRKKLEEQLAEAKKDLEESEYEHSVEVQEDALNKQYEAYEKERNDEIDALRESLNDKETIIAESFNTVKKNAATVGQEIATIATQHGITVSKTLISSWQSGEKAIASYGAVLSQNTSAFIGNIMDVENEVWNLQAQANTTADSLAWMFSTKADNLVNELTTSYYAESNLAYMTQALQNSLINTLERGYNVNSIVNSLNSIEGAADRAKTAIDRLNSYRSELEDKNLDDLYVDDVGSNPLRNYFKAYPGEYLIETGKVHTGDLTSMLSSAFENVGNLMKLKKYASGTRSSKGAIFISDENGYEMKLPKLANGQYTIANEGTQVLTKTQTDNIFEWAKFNPEDFVPVNMTDYMDNLRTSTMPTILPNNVVNNSSVNVHYDSMINVQGSINNTDVKQMEAIANNAVDRMVDKINDGITYGR